MAASNSSKHAPSISETHRPCAPLSPYHDLSCPGNHRIRTPYNEDCGPNCKTPYVSSSQTETSLLSECAFVCPVCFAAELKAHIAEKGVKEKNSDQVMDPSVREGRIREMTQEKIGELIAAGHRICEEAPKVDPVLQFYNEFPEAQEGGGFLQSPQKPARNDDGEVAPILGSKELFKRPSAQRTRYRERSQGRTAGRDRSRSPTAAGGDERDGDEANLRGRPEAPALSYEGDSMDDLAGHLGDTKVGLEKEDEATKAVREVLGSLVLDEKEKREAAEGTANEVPRAVRKGVDEAQK
ncbi:hypothetical protein BU26DRAFT_586498 [Trematosphaeria pertusa]|uniref:Uncharacterized protein n=1 Tax=Trematosphaeria pertusa TaxID=390896 RepID=A0A6A6HTR0_9PLEO|nr:uncharacterized protein BU26DRAFT_586498 [Trematosphaeria pertusa]KAF2241299.1 hypothetical protein BU26DRAFT_586498 [Trematosphaeria pertusa]